MARIDFNNYKYQIDNFDDVIVSFAANMMFRHGEPLYLNNFDTNRYSLFIEADGELGGPYKNRSLIIAGMTNRLDKIKDKLQGNLGSNNLIFVNLQVKTCEKRAFKTVTVPNITFINGISMSLSFVFDIKVEYAVKPERAKYLILKWKNGVDRFMGQRFLDCVYNSFAKEMEKHIQDAVKADAIETYNDALQSVRKAIASGNEETGVLKDHLKSLFGPEYEDYYITNLFITVRCDQEAELEEEGNKIPAIDRELEVKAAQTEADNNVGLLEEQGKIDVEQLRFNQNESNRLVSEGNDDTINRGHNKVEHEKKLQDLSITTKERATSDLLDLFKKMNEQKITEAEWAYKILNDYVAKGGVGIDIGVVKDGLNDLRTALDTNSSMQESLLSQVKDLLSIINEKDF